MSKSSRILAALTVFVTCSHAMAQLFGIDIGPNSRLLNVNTNTGTYSTIGPIAVSPMNGLAYNPLRNTLWGIGTATNSLYKIDMSSAQTTLIGSLGPVSSNANGLAYDPIGRRLYMTDNHNNTLYLVNQTTGAATKIAPIGGGFREIEGLGYDAQDRVLYGISSLDRRIVRINTQTGVATPIPGPLLPSGNWRGLEFDPGRRVLYTSIGNQVWQVAPTTGLYSHFTTLANVDSVQGLAMIPAPGTICFVLPAIAFGCLRKRR